MLKLTGRQLAHIIVHARAGAPDEVCGLILGDPRDGVARGVYRVPNVAADPRVTYYMRPETQLLLFDFADRRGWAVLGIYHSHPRGPDAPSATDLAQSYYPEAVYVIVSLAGALPAVRAFRIAAGRAEATPVSVVTGQGARGRA